jgi:hypothetical protein
MSYRQPTVKTPKAEKGAVPVQTPDDISMLYNGASKNQLADLFAMDIRDVTRKIADIPPSGKRGAYPIWKVKDVAPVLARLHLSPVEIEEKMRNMNPNELPPMLSKFFWEALRSRARYEEEAGDLWKTSDVITVVGEAFKELSMGLKTLPDALERQSSLTETQKSAIQKAVDNLMEQLHGRLIRNFGKPSTKGSSDEAESEDGEL